MNLSGRIVSELKAHAPFTVLGTVSGIAIMLLFVLGGISKSVSASLFWTFHPIHVVLSALVTAGMYRRNSSRRLLPTLLVGYFGSIGIATLSDSIIPFAGEWLLDLPNRGIHIGFIQKWYLVNPLAVAGAAIAYVWPRTKFPHAGHVFLSTWASLFHMTMALGSDVNPLALIAIPIFLFLAVWLPCCTSDIVFPLLFVGDRATLGDRRAQSARH